MGIGGVRGRVQERGVSCEGRGARGEGRGAGSNGGVSEWPKPELRLAAIGPLLHAGRLQAVLKRSRIVRCEPVARALCRWRQVSQQKLQMRQIITSGLTTVWFSG